MTASVRSATWSFANIAEAWLLIVLLARPSFPPITVVDSPAASSSRTCRSRGVSCGKGSVTAALPDSRPSTRRATPGPNMASPPATARIARNDLLLGGTLEHVAFGTSPHGGEDRLIVIEH